MRVEIRLFVILIVVSFALCSWAAEEQNTSATDHPEIRGALASLDAWVDAYQAYERIPGLSVGIVLDQELIWSSGYGFANVADQRIADVDTIYSICSISKLFTSIGIMQLRDAGELQLRDPVDQHLDWFNIKQAHGTAGPVTIEGLLTHSSGLPRESDYPYWGGPDFPFPTRAEMHKKLGEQETLYPASTYFQYSNLGMALAGEIIEARTGLAYTDYVFDKILKPLGLTDTRPYFPTDLYGEQMAIGYSGLDRSGQRRPVEPFFTRGITPAAGFTSSVTDLARFASWQFQLLEQGGKNVIDANTLREMHRVHWVDPDWKTTWGLGFVASNAEGTTLVGHGGGCPGYITSFQMVPKYKLAAIALTNASDGGAGTITRNILKTIGAALEKVSTPAQQDLPDFSKYEGNYEVQPWGGEWAIRQWGDQLVLIPLPTDDLTMVMQRLKHVDGNEFVRIKDDEPRETVSFQLDEVGRAMSFTRHSMVVKRIR